ncbi:MAG: aminotransferase class V-fold PLP-dependent enzyme [Nevskia sp.]
MNNSYKLHFSRFLTAVPGRVHAAAHSHHPWPNVSFEAQAQAWLDAAEHIDGKWDKVFGTVLPQAQAHVARHLHLPDPATICFAGNTHELFMRLMSCIARKPMRVLTTDGEFHSFNRQLQRLEEAGLAQVERIAVEPFASFSERFSAAAAQGGHELVYFSQCFFNSGYLLHDLPALVGAVRDAETLVVIDGYHGYMALHTDLSTIAERAFYLSGGYKYAMCGEGTGFMHCPPAYAARPVDTGWFAGFAALSQGAATIPYAAAGMRFMGATYDPTGLYRLNAVMAFLQEHKLTPARIHARVAALQDLFLDALAKLSLPALNVEQLIPGRGQPRGNFLTFRTPRAGELHAELKSHKVITDYREDRLRIGFGVYHDEGDMAELVQRVAVALG